MEENVYEIDVKDILRILKKRFLVIFSTTLVVVLLVGVFSFYVMVPVYNTSTTMLVSYKQNQESIMTYNDLMASQKLVNTYTEIIKSRKILDQVAEELNLDLTLDKLGAMVTVSPVKDTEIIRVSVENTDPTLAASIANTVSEIFQDDISDIMQVDNVVTIDVADVPEKPIKPNKVLYILIAGVVGGMASVGMVLFIEFMNRTFKTPTDIERHLGLPLIGAIPDINSVEKVSRSTKRG